MPSKDPTNKQYYHKVIENDEYYTPKVLVDPILPYIKKGSTVWLPFDKANSEFNIVLSENGFTCIYTHIEEGYDFFEYEPETHYDYIISNIPFSAKMAVLERLHLLNKPFAVLINLNILNYQTIGAFFLDKPLQLLIVDKKVSFDGCNTAFNTSYFCKDMLPKDIIFCHIPHNNTRKHFIPSAAYLEAYDRRQQHKNEGIKNGPLYVKDKRQKIVND